MVARGQDQETKLSDAVAPSDAHPSSLELTSTELSSRRTGMSFQRTRMSADRTLMSVIRTALSMIGFGFTIYQAFRHLQQARVTPANSHAPASFAVALVALGAYMLALGIGYHVRYMAELRRERASMVRAGLVHGESCYPVSMTLITASLLLAVGLCAIASMVFGIGPLR
jgi:putative membrane protein